MEHSHTYRVISHGMKDKEGNSELVINQLAKTFSLKNDRARAYLDKKNLVVKKNVSLTQAQKYKDRLERIGLNVELVAEPKDYNAEKRTLGLEPAGNTGQLKLQTESDKVELCNGSEILCNNCGFRQAKGKFCISCGSQLSSSALSLNNQDTESLKSNNPDETHERSVISSIIICLLSGVLGTFIYHFILPELITQQGVFWGAIKGGIAGLIMGMVLDKTGPHKISMTYLVIATLIICFNGDWILEETFSQL